MPKQQSDDQQSDFPRAIGNPARRALALAGYTRLDQLPQVSAAALLQLHGVGPKAIGVLRQALAEKGLSFAADTRAKAE
jgi:hypothetical protein